MNFHSKKILALIIICNVAVLTGYYALFQKIKADTKLASALNSTVNISEQKTGRLSSLRAVIKDTEGKRQQLAAFLLSSDAGIPFIEQIENLAKTSGLVEKTDSVSSVAGSNNATKIFQMQLETTGSWSSTMYFLNQLESLPYNIRVQKVFFDGQSAGDKGAGSLWLAAFDISVTEKI